MAKQATQQKEATFSSVLDMPSGDIDRSVKQPPIGSYLVVVQGIPEEGKSSKKETPYSDFNFKFIEAQDDVDEDALEAFLTNADGTKRRLTDCSLKQKFYHTEASFGRLVDLLDHLDGIKPGSDESKEMKDSPRQRLSEVAGKQCVIHVKHEPWQSGEGVSARVSGTSLAE
jgi:hypothetical protein